MTSSLTICFRTFFYSLALLTVVACGGGGGGVEREPTAGGGTGGNGGGTPTPTVSVAVTIADQDGNAVNSLSASTPLTVSATVSNSEGTLLVDELVTFSFSQDELASFSNDAGTALTNSSGIATIGLLVGNDSGDALVVATVDGGVTGQVGFSSTGNSQTGSLPASLEFFASSTQLASSGSDEIELIAVVKNAQNILLSGVEVSFAANNGAELRIDPNNRTTADDGTARAILTSRSNPENRVVTATVSSGTFSETLDIDIVGTEINVDGPSSVVLGDTASITIKVADSDGNGLANRQVNLTASQGSIVSSATTDNEGQVAIQYEATNSGQNTITATALNAQGSLDFVVQEDSFSFTTTPNEDVALSDQATLSITWLKDNLPFAGGQVTLSSSRGTVLAPNATTDASGVATFSISSNNAGLTSITAEGVDGNGESVSARTQFEFVATSASTIIVDASPDLIGPEGQTTTISAVVRDATGNLVKGKVINFRVDDVSGGFVSPNSATTDSNGIASTVYTSNAVSSEDAVIVHADVAENLAVTDFTTLTVGDRAFDISLGTGRIIQSPDDSSYLKEFSVFVSDAVGRPVANVELTVSSTPVKFSAGGVYRKGFWQFDTGLDVWLPVTTAICVNEDINGNGSLDAGEDTNNDGKLTPGIIGTISFADGLDSTNSNGQAKLEVRYPKAFGNWVDVEISAFGQSAGSEAFDSQNFTLGVAAADLSDEASPPAGNPYGFGANCSDTL